jgi:DNA repair exonuclease SbcCD ATPase subunit
MKLKGFAFLVLAVFLVGATALVMAKNSEARFDSAGDDSDEHQVIVERNATTDDDETHVNETHVNETDDESDDNETHVNGTDDESDDCNETHVNGTDDCNETHVNETKHNETEDNEIDDDNNSRGGMPWAVAGKNMMRQEIVQRFVEKHPDIVQKFLDRLSANDSDKIGKLDRERLKECLNNTDDCQEKLKDMKVVKEKVKDRLRQREIADDDLLEAENKFLKAKDKYLEAKNWQLKAEDEFKGLKLKLAECKLNNTNCTELENKTFEKAQEDLLAIADRLIQHLEKVKSRVESAENLNATEAQDAIDKIDSLIADLEDAKGKVEAADTQAELKAATELIRDAWKEIQSSVFQYAEEVIYSRVGEVFARSELLETRLEAVVEKLKAKGINITQIEGELDNFSAKIEDARTKMTQANKLFAEANDLRAGNKTAEAKETLEEAKNLTQEAHQDLKDAHSILQDLVHMINQKGESFDPDEIDEDEEVELVEEDD